MEAKWILGLCSLGAALGFGVLLHHADVSVSAQVITLASSIVTGAFGAAAGHAVGKASTVNTGGAPATINTGDPSTPTAPQEQA